MANMKEILPQGEYKIANVGPSRTWEFTGNDGKVEMITDSIQLEGHEQYWVDMNRKSTSDAPKIGDTLKGKVEQDEAGKYAPKFAKEKSGNGSWRGGGQASPGAIWATAVQTATAVVSGYYAASGTKPKNFAEFLARIEAVAPKVNGMVDKLSGAATTAAAKKADTAASESGESPAPAATEKKADVIIEDIDDAELGEW